ncbi:MAG: YraN family protein [Patescibacteria group bacterium]
MHPRRSGSIGEELACKYLASHGFKIIKKNFTISGGEVDIIAKKADLLVFIEVKTRTNESFGNADESINFAKKRSLKRTVAKYLAKFTSGDVDYRVDLIEIELDRYTSVLVKINHLEDIEL